MNKMKEVAALLGVELGEEFRLYEECHEKTYMLDMEGLYIKKCGDLKWELDCPKKLNDLLLGDLTIEEIPPREFQIGDIVGFEMSSGAYKGIIVAFSEFNYAIIIALDSDFEGHTGNTLGVKLDNEFNNSWYAEVDSLTLIREVQDFRAPKETEQEEKTYIIQKQYEDCCGFIDYGDGHEKEMKSLSSCLGWFEDNSDTFEDALLDNERFVVYEDHDDCYRFCFAIDKFSKITFVD